MGATMDLEILRELFTGCKKAAEILGDAVAVSYTHLDVYKRQIHKRGKTGCYSWS